MYVHWARVVRFKPSTCAEETFSIIPGASHSSPLSLSHLAIQNGFHVGDARTAHNVCGWHIIFHGLGTGHLMMIIGMMVIMMMMMMARTNPTIIHSQQHSCWSVQCCRLPSENIAVANALKYNPSLRSVIKWRTLLRGFRLHNT